MRNRRIKTFLVEETFLARLKHFVASQTNAGYSFNKIAYRLNMTSQRLKRLITGDTKSILKEDFAIIEEIISSDDYKTSIMVKKANDFADYELLINKKVTPEFLVMHKFYQNLTTEEIRTKVLIETDLWLKKIHEDHAKERKDRELTTKEAIQSVCLLLDKQIEVTGAGVTKDMIIAMQQEQSQETAEQKKVASQRIVLMLKDMLKEGKNEPGED